MVENTKNKKKRDSFNLKMNRTKINRNVTSFIVFILFFFHPFNFESVLVSVDASTKLLHVLSLSLFHFSFDSVQCGGSDWDIYVISQTKHVLFVKSHDGIWSLFGDDIKWDAVATRKRSTNQLYLIFVFFRLFFDAFQCVCNVIILNEKHSNQIETEKHRDLKEPQAEKRKIKRRTKDYKKRTQTPGQSVIEKKRKKKNYFFFIISDLNVCFDYALVDMF